MFDMFDMYVKLPPDASPIAVNKFYLLTYFDEVVGLVRSNEPESYAGRSLATGRAC